MLDFITVIKKNKNGAPDTKRHRFSESERGISFSTLGLSKNQPYREMRDSDPATYKIAMDVLAKEKVDLDK